MCANFGFAALGARIALMIGSDREAPGAARRAEGCEETLLRDGAVKRIALAGDAAERENEVPHFRWRPLLFVDRPGRSGDGFEHHPDDQIVDVAPKESFQAA